MIGAKKVFILLPMKFTLERVVKLKELKLVLQRRSASWDINLMGYGITASYTYADSEVNNQHTLNPDDKLPLEDLSKNSYNIIAFYEYEKFSSRLAYNWRSKYLDKSEGRNLEPQYERDRSQLDFSTKLCNNK